eukprot:scaffold1720_cov353-Pavlova_lutheri.AAC.5
MCPPFLRACSVRATTVEKYPGPALTTSRSPAATGGQFMSPTTLTCLPRWYNLIANERTTKPSLPTP